MKVVNGANIYLGRNLGVLFAWNGKRYVFLISKINKYCVLHHHRSLDKIEGEK